MYAFKILDLQNNYINALLVCRTSSFIKIIRQCCESLTSGFTLEDTHASDYYSLVVKKENNVNIRQTLHEREE